VAEILFPEPAKYGANGRNGITKAHGLHISDLFGEIQIQPINSRGDVSRCRIPVPREALPALIKELQALV
jgi:hypothetical protein